MASINECLKRDWSICWECAIANGAEPSPGHMATVWQGPCSVCEEEKMCKSASDWNWPGRKDRRKIEAMREF